MNKEAADAVVAELRSQYNAKAGADYNSVVDGEKVVETAISLFGTVHVIINNAGVLRDVSFARMTDDQWDIVMKTHIYGTYAVCKAAWAKMREQQYGRIVNVTSVNGLYGQRGQANYSAAKGAIVGFTKTLAKEGKSKNIKVNVVAPGAGTAMTATVMPKELVDAWKPEYVAPLVNFLCHEECPCTGDIFESGGGFTAQVKWMRTEGVYFDLEKPFGPEQVKEQWSKITSWDGAPDFPDDEKLKEDSDPFANKQIKQILARL
jgi:NAD(P)-dependent dehydrogenase (short-subunit alcohol dehydrogenase family)